MNEHADQGGFKSRGVWVVSAPGDEPGGEMMTIRSRIAAVFAVASLTLAFTGQSHATVFAAWQVANVLSGDALNVRKYPSGTSQKQAAYPNGTVLRTTGRFTGGTNLLDIANQPAWKQRQTVLSLVDPEPVG
ncbi:SH3 domain-containing protein [Mesorhizobium sp. AR07]|uniref:SH3 domain-containing protein n=1 Tax=Mesorhizobium sp. AR07 TaxID=2865838 RepID=UPI0021608AD8|nr:SH3 domain-containing protein [Mesorhizobium sp. AR07]